MPNPRRHNSSADRQRAYRERRKQVRLNALQPQDLPPHSPIPSVPSLKRWRILREQARAALQKLYDEMETYQSERAEAWQHGEKGASFQENLDKVEEAIQALEDIL